MTDDEGFENLEDATDGLAHSLSSASTLAAAFAAEMKQMQDTLEAAGKQAQKLSDTFSGGLRKAIDGVILDGKSFSEAMRAIGADLVDAAFDAALKPVTDQAGLLLGGLVSSLNPFAKGGAFSQGRVTAFASGGVVNGATHFPMRGGLGLMGEAGPEAIMPLARGPDGKLGVAAAGGGKTVNVVMNIQTPDAQSFSRSSSQIAAQMSRALSRGTRNR